METLQVNEWTPEGDKRGKGSFLRTLLKIQDKADQENKAVDWNSLATSIVYEGDEARVVFSYNYLEEE